MQLPPLFVVAPTIGLLVTNTQPSVSGGKSLYLPVSRIGCSIAAGRSLYRCRILVRTREERRTQVEGRDLAVRWVRGTRKRILGMDLRAADIGHKHVGMKDIPTATSIGSEVSLEWITATVADARVDDLAVGLVETSGGLFRLLQSFLEYVC